MRKKQNNIPLTFGENGKDQNFPSRRKMNEEGKGVVEPDDLPLSDLQLSPDVKADQNNLLLECVGDVCEIKPPSNGKGDDKKKKQKKNAGGSASSSFIQTIHSQQELSTLLESKDAVIVEFMTTWCGACAGIAPLYEELAQSAAEEQDDPLQAAQVICDKNKETKKLATTFSVGSYPVFVVFENGTESSRWNGADRGKLEKAFERGSGGGRGGKGKKKKGGKGGKGRK
jgi:thiol-disulfide isomerase/thioredoxin